MKISYFLFAGLFFFVLIMQAQSASCQAPAIIPDGKTPTQVSVQENGRSVVNIAQPVRDGVSYNSYSQFSVDRFGADINNREAAARLIINEVNGTLPSVVEGDIAILGPRANFILANENGIRIDGGSFTNMGSIALTTGRVELYDFNPAPDISRRDVLLRTNRGLIEIGGNGLTGAFNRLDLIAKNIRINGAVRNAYDNPNAAVRVIAGDSLAQINSNISPVDDASDWLAFQGEGTANQDLIVDITPLGSLSSGRIEIAVTDKGAGMRHAGEILARAGDFILSSGGEVVFEGGQSHVAQTTLIRAERVTMASADSNAPTTITSGKDVQIVTPEFHLSGVKIIAGTEDQEGHVVIGASNNPSQGFSSIAGVAFPEGGFSPSHIQATGSVLVGSEAQALQMSGVDIEANASIGLFGTRIAITAPDSGAYFSSLDAKGGVLSVKASDEVTIESAKLQGGAAVDLTAAQLLIRQQESSPQDPTTQIVSNGGNVHLKTRGDVLIEGAEVLAFKSIIAETGKDVRLSSRHDRQAKLFASEGSLLIDAKGVVFNDGGYLRGKAADPDIENAADSVLIKAALGFQNITSREDHLAVVFAEKGDISIFTDGDFINQSGRIIANGNLAIVAKGDIRNFLGKIPGENGEEKTYYTKTKKRFFGLLRSKRRGYVIDYGKALVDGNLAYLIADGDVKITGRNVYSIGGEIAANNGNLLVQAEESVFNQAVRTGQVEYSSNCHLFGCQRLAQSNVALLGGNMGASQELRIVAGESVLNQGGSMTGIQGLSVESPITTLQSLENYQIVSRTHGMRSFFGNTYAQVYRNDMGGILQSTQGDVCIRGDVVRDGGEMIAVDGQISVEGENILLRDPIRERPGLNGIHNGIFSFL